MPFHVCFYFAKRTCVVRVSQPYVEQLFRGDENSASALKLSSFVYAFKFSIFSKFKILGDGMTLFGCHVNVCLPIFLHLYVPMLVTQRDGMPYFKRAETEMNKDIPINNIEDIQMKYDILSRLNGSVTYVIIFISITAVFVSYRDLFVYRYIYSVHIKEIKRFVAYL